MKNKQIEDSKARTEDSKVRAELAATRIELAAIRTEEAEIRIEEVKKMKNWVSGRSVKCPYCEKELYHYTTECEVAGSHVKKDKDDIFMTCRHCSKNVKFEFSSKDGEEPCWSISDPEN